MLAQEIHSSVDRVRLVEVGPRDGLQNSSVLLSARDKVRLINRLADAGHRDIEAGAFVHPRWIPQMAETSEVFQLLKPREGVRYWALVPNMRGLQRAIDVNVRHVAVFLSSSETHNRRNLNRTIDESLENVRVVAKAALKEGMTLRGYISTVFGCPYEGDVDFDRVLEIAERLFDIGVDEVSFGDTTGMGEPLAVEEKLVRAVERFGADRIALHLHDTRGVAQVIASMALAAGWRIFDSSIGGMGGCPYAPGAAGNLATEDLVHLLDGFGVAHDLDLMALARVSRHLQRDHAVPITSRYYPYIVRFVEEEELGLRIAEMVQERA